MPTVDEALAAARTALDDLEAAIGAPAPAAAPVPEPAAETETPAEDAAPTETDTDTVTAPASELAPDLPKGVQQ